MHQSPQDTTSPDVMSRRSSIAARAPIRSACGGSSGARAAEHSRKQSRKQLSQAGGAVRVGVSRRSRKQLSVTDPDGALLLSAARRGAVLLSALCSLLRAALCSLLSAAAPPRRRRRSRRLDARIGPEQIDAAWASIDADGSGGTDYDEFRYHDMTSHSPPAARPSARRHRL